VAAAAAEQFVDGVEAGMASAHLIAETTIPSTPSAEPFVYASRAAQYLGLPRPLVLKWARSGVLKGYPLGIGRKHKWLFRLNELSAALERKSNSPAPLVYEKADHNYASASPKLARKRKAMGRYQQGSVRIEQRSAGPTWIYRFYVTKTGRRVEHTRRVGLVAT